MSILEYQSRSQQLFDFLYSEPKGVLRRYRVPEYLGDNQLRAEINDLVEDINRQIPVGFIAADFRLLLPKIHRVIRSRHTPQGWPPAKTFIAATQEALIEVDKLRANERFGEKPEEWKSQEVAFWAKKIVTGDVVPESMLWGPQAIAMIKSDLVDEASLARYRELAYQARVELYNREQADKWLAEQEVRHSRAH